MFSNKRVCKRGGAGRTRKKSFFFKYKHTKTYTETGALNRCLDLSCRSDTQERVHVMINHESSKKMSSYQTHDMWVTCSRVFLLLPRCQKGFHFHTMFLRVDSCFHFLLAVVRVCSGFLFRSPNWHPSLQDGYVRDKLMHINMQIHLMGVQSLAQCNFSFLSLLWFSSTRNLPSTEHLESSKQILRFPNSLGRFVSKFKPIFHLQLPFPTKQKILLSSKQAAIF